MRADRLIAMLMLLQTKGRMTAQELSDRLEVSTRTVYRDLDALSASGVPVYAERGPNGGCELLERYRTNLTGLTEPEVKALFMFTVPNLMADLGADKASEAAMLKLTASLPAPFQKNADEVRSKLHLDAAGWFQPKDPVPYLAMLQDAVWQEQRVRMEYRRGDGRWVKRLIDPLGLVAKASVWYVVGAIYGGMTMVYRVSRIQSAEVTGSHFVRPVNFDLNAFWQAWVDQFEQKQASFSVSIRVQPEGVVSLTHQLGEGVMQLVMAAESMAQDGSVVIDLQFASVEDACQKLAGLGTAVQILTPDSLRQHLAEHAKSLLEMYE
ncbi:MAG: YafY family transcriptional regulator [Chloroflexi bacterium]|nr:MAG: YafY family transcriptional regulator [Chloroflexota bacterium]